jgi:hypothetical protein
MAGVQRFIGRGGLAIFLEISATRVDQLKVPPDAIIDGRPAWSPETATRVKAERAARRRKRRGASQPEAVA